MRYSWIPIALVASALTAGCNQNSPKVEETPATAPAPAAVPQPETPPQPPPAPPASVSLTTDTPARAETARPRASAPSRPPSRPAAAPQTIESRATAPAASETPAPRLPPVQYRQLKLAAGAALPLELLTPLSSETTPVEAPVRAKLKQSISVEGFPVLPAGTILSGNVTDVAQAGRVKGRSRIVMAFTEATVDGAREKLKTNPITFEGEASKGEDATKIGAGAGIGAAIGGILGGGSGAAKGAAIGGAAGTGAVLATKGKDVIVAEGADVAATLAEPFELRVRVP